MDIDHLRGWIGHEQRASERVAPARVAALWATLDRLPPAPADGSALPPLYHWLYFLTHARQSELGADGHPARGGFLPPVPLPRRMWAGSRIRYVGQVAVGSTLVRIARVADVRLKQGRSGSLVFVTLDLDYFDGEGGLRIQERQDIVYRDAAPTPPPSAGSIASRASETGALTPQGLAHAAAAMEGGTGGSPGDLHRSLVPDAPLLFRYSALTFNGHRIHYDLAYARGVEAYPALVVHGPLMATLLADTLLEVVPDRPVLGLTIRAEQAAFADGRPLHIRSTTAGDQTRLWVENAEGQRCMQLQAHHSTMPA